VTEKKTKQIGSFKRNYYEHIRQQKKIRLVMDNYGTHTLQLLCTVSVPSLKIKRIWDRFEFIYTPNMAVG